MEKILSLIKARRYIKTRSKDIKDKRTRREVISILSMVKDYIEEMANPQKLPGSSETEAKTLI